MPGTEAFSGNLSDPTEMEGARRAWRPLGSFRDILAVLSAPGHRAGFHGLFSPRLLSAALPVELPFGRGPADSFSCFIPLRTNTRASF